MTKTFFKALAAIALLALSACTQDEINQFLNDGKEIPATSITLDVPLDAELKVGETLTITAKVEPENTTDKVEWVSLYPEIASVENGVVTGLKEGIASIEAKAGKVMASCRIVVRKADDGGGNGGSDKAVERISVDPAVTKITIGADGILTAIITPEDAKADIKWVSDNTQVVTVEKTSDRQAKITGVSVGTTKVLAMVGDMMAFSEVTVERDGGSGGGGSSTINSASVDPSFVALGLGQEQVVSLIMDPEDAEVTIYWESQASYVAKVQMVSKTQAKITGVGVGQTVVTVHAGDLTANCQVSVTDSDNSVPVESVTLDRHELTLSVNQQYQFTATVLPENASNKNVVWASSANSAKLYISSTGQLTALQPCEATITVRCQANPMIYDTCQVTVTGGSSDPGEEVVDLGLPSGLKWRGWNVGASKPEEYGNYYAWAETSTKSKYTGGNYKWGPVDYGDGMKLYTKYETKLGGDKKSVLEPEDDAASVNLGNGWRTPTFKEFKELRESCTWTWTKRNGVNGMQVTGPNGKSIFLPAAGVFRSSLENQGTYGSYWASTLSGVEGMADAVDFISGDKSIAAIAREYGLSVRPVKD
ncbi:MAG: Ig-like domain-containing protein [Bacteroidales bacterium]|nr:Ig-like domain-containing protein [Bacteroidales bacterium]